MVVGVLRVVLAIPEAGSLKDKRRVVRRVLDRARAKFNVAAAEVDMMDAHRRAVLGFTVVSNDGRHARSMLDTIAAFVGSTSAGEAMVTSRKAKVETRSDLGGLGGDLDGSDFAPDDLDDSDDDDDDDEADA